MLCDDCGLREATLFWISIVEMRMHRIRLCEPCGAEAFQIGEYVQYPTPQAREHVYELLHRRLRMVAQRLVGSDMALRPELDDIVQEAIGRFLRQEALGTGIFDRDPRKLLSPKILAGNIKANIVHRRADLLRRRQKQHKIIGCSYDATPPESTSDRHLDRLVNHSAVTKKLETDFLTGLGEVITAYLSREANPVAVAAVLAAMEEGRFNSASLGREQGVSQPTVWRELRALKRRLRAALEREDFGPAQDRDEK